MCEDCKSHQGEGEGDHDGNQHDGDCSFLWYRGTMGTLMDYGGCFSARGSLSIDYRGQLPERDLLFHGAVGIWVEPERSRQDRRRSGSKYVEMDRGSGELLLDILWPLSAISTCQPTTPIDRPPYHCH